MAGSSDGQSTVMCAPQIWYTVLCIPDVRRQAPIDAAAYHDPGYPDRSSGEHVDRASVANIMREEALNRSRGAESVGTSEALTSPEGMQNKRLAVGEDPILQRSNLPCHGRNAPYARAAQNGRDAELNNFDR